MNGVSVSEVESSKSEGKGSDNENGVGVESKNYWKVEGSEGAIEWSESD